MAATTAAQTPAPGAARNAKELAAGWAALAEGRAADAERASDAVLQAAPRSHDAITLKIRARLSASADAARALDVYEQWLPKVQQHEDTNLLELIAVAIVESQTASKTAAVRIRALELLAAAGDRTAVERLSGLTTGAGSAALLSNAALARAGDADAAQRITTRVERAGSEDVAEAIDVLRDLRATSAVPALVAALAADRPLPTRLAAANALGQLGIYDAVAPLKALLNDPAPPVRIQAAAALMKLGDASGADVMRMLESSPVGDFRLLAVESSATSSPTGAWVAVATEVLKDPDPLVRLRAAQLLLQHAMDTGPARQLLAESLADPNPAMRTAAARVMERVPPSVLANDLPSLRKLLRDASPLVQLGAASAILHSSGAIPR